MNKEVETETSPYLSVVVATRNDDHGGRLIERTQAFIDGLSEQSRRFALKIELVIVEWNPPVDRPRLDEVFRWPGRDSNLRVRIIEVPDSLHRLLRHSEALPIFQMIAKNVGIRAARGQFVLATNPDILFSNELIRYLAKQELKDRRYYRAERHDVSQYVTEQGSVQERLEYCQAHVIRAWKRYVSIDYTTGRVQPTYPRSEGLGEIHALLWALGFLAIFNFLRIRYQPTIRRFRQRARHPRSRVSSRRHLVETWQYLRTTKLNLGTKFPRVTALRWADYTMLRLEDLGVLVSNFLMTVVARIMSVEARIRSRALQNFNDLMAMSPPSRPRLFTYACGDFTLLSKRDWARLRGYPELPIFSLHIDSLLLYAAHYSGIEEICLKQPIYHIEHSRGWAAVMDSASPYEDLRGKGVPILSIEDFYSLTDELGKNNRGALLNTENWGLGNQSLREIEPQPRLEWRVPLAQQ